MREIKFRAWNQDTLKMYYDISNKETYLGELMQFTGLKDKMEKKYTKEI